MTRSRSILLVVAGIGYSSRLMINIERWQEEQDAEQRRKDAMKLGDEERETILQVMMIMSMMTHENRVSMLKAFAFSKWTSDSKSLIQ